MIIVALLLLLQFYWQHFWFHYYSSSLYMWRSFSERLVVSNLLRKCCYNVTVCHSGSEAIHVLTSSRGIIYIVLINSFKDTIFIFIINIIIDLLFSTSFSISFICQHITLNRLKINLTDKHNTDSIRYKIHYTDYWTNTLICFS